jgi:hypothetical protein
MRIVKYSSEAIGTLCLALASYFISSGQRTVSLCFLLLGVMFWVIGLALKVQRDFGLIDEERPTVLGLNNTPITRAEIQQELPPDPPALQDTESNIVVCWDGQDNSHRVTVARHQERLYFREASDDEEDRSLSWRTVIVQFRNESSPPKRIGRVANVTAEILYYESSNPDVVTVRTTGCWLNEPSAAIPFDPDVPRFLVLALFWRIQNAHGPSSFNLDVYDANHPEFMVWRNGATEIRYKIVVKLRWGEHNEFGIDERFELISTIAGQFKSFELFRLTDQVGNDGQSIKISRGDMDLW